MYEWPAWVAGLLWGGIAVAMAIVFWPLTLLVIGAGVVCVILLHKRATRREAERRQQVLGHVQWDRAQGDAYYTKLVVFEALSSGERPSIAMFERRLGLTRTNATAVMAWAEQERWVSPSLDGQRRRLLLDPEWLASYLEISRALDRHRA